MGKIYTPPQRGLVGWWPLNEGAGTKAYDLSGKGNHGTLTNNPTWVGGKRGAAINCNGTNNYVAIATSTPYQGTEISISLWSSNTSTANNCLLGAAANDLATRINVHMPYAGVVYWDFGLIQNGGRISKTAPTLTDGWHHWVFQASGGNSMRIYLDGALWASQAWADSAGYTGSDALTIGGFLPTGSPLSWYYFPGSIDDVRIYNRALSPAEVLELYYYKPPTYSRYVSQIWVGGGEPIIVPPSGSDLSLSLSGISVSAVQGLISENIAVTLSGVQVTGTQGTLTASTASNVTLNLTGISITGSQGLLPLSISTALTGTSVTGTQGTITEGVSTALTGTSVTGTQGIITEGVSTALTGTSVTGTQGTITKGISTALTGTSVTGTQGTITEGVSTALTGTSVTGTQGIISEGISTALTGTSVTGTQGIITVSIGGNVTIPLTGYSISTNQGSLGIGVSLALSGVSIITSQGIISVSIGNDVTTSLTGQNVASSLGTISRNIAISLPGIPVSFNQGNLAIDLSKGITGDSGTLSQGTLVNNISKALAGLQGSFTQGILTVVANDVTIILNGAQITGTTGLLGIGRNISVAGNLATFNQGSIALGAMDLVNIAELIYVLTSISEQVVTSVENSTTVK